MEGRPRSPGIRDRRPVGSSSATSPTCSASVARQGPGSHPLEGLGYERRHHAVDEPGPPSRGEDLHHGPVVETLEVALMIALCGITARASASDGCRGPRARGLASVDASGTALHAIERRVVAEHRDAIGRQPTSNSTPSQPGTASAVARAAMLFSGACRQSPRVPVGARLSRPDVRCDPDMVARVEGRVLRIGTIRRGGHRRRGPRRGARCSRGSAGRHPCPWPRPRSPRAT